MPRPKRKGSYRKPEAKKDWTSRRKALFERNVVFAATLRYYRISKDVTARELALELGVAVTTVYNRESGRINLDDIKVHKLIVAINRISKKIHKAA
jgi:DNA-binding XRE family transcriptional regulator